MKNEELRKLKELPILGVALRLGIKLRGHWALCVFHEERHMSLHFSKEKNICKCYSCGRAEDTIGLTMHVTGLGFKEACKWLADENNMIISEFDNKQRKEKPQRKTAACNREYLERLMERPRLTAEARHFLFDERRISADVARKTGISSIGRDISMNGSTDGPWFNAPALLLPYRDVDGRLLNVQARYLGKEKKQRFQFPKGSVCPMFNLPQLAELTDNDNLYISEGPTDCLAMLTSGKKAIAIPSATTLTEEDKRMLKERLPKTTTLHSYPDQDAAGESLWGDLAGMANDLGLCIVRHRLPEGCKDYGEFFATSREPSICGP